MKNELEGFYHKSSIKEAEKTCWQNLYGCSIGLALASTVTTKPYIVITPDILTASRLEQELRFFLGDQKDKTQILNFPGWETLPYDHFSPHEDVVSQRLLSLYQLPNLNSGVVFVDVATLMHRLPPKNYIETNSFVLEIKEDVDFILLRKKLESHGYSCVTKVMEHGEFAVRGSIIDIFPMGSDNPFRIDLLDTAVDTIRIFDVDTQRSFKNIDSIKLLPAKEFPLSDEAIDKFCQSWRSRFDGNPLKCPVYENITSNKNHPGIEYYLPLFFEHTSTLFDYLPPNSTVILVNGIEKNMLHFWGEVERRYEQLRHDRTYPILAPQDIFISPDQVSTLINNYPQIIINNNEYKVKDDENQAPYCFKTKKYEDILSDVDTKTKISSLQTAISLHPNIRMLFIAESAGRREALLEILHGTNISPTPVDSWHEFVQSSNKSAITVAQVEQPLHIILEENNAEILIITESQIFGEQAIKQRQSTTTTQKTDAIIHDLIELQISAPVVHIDYGVGRYLGLQKLQTDDHETEFLVLEYANAAKLYVPVTSFGLISRYTGVDAEHAPLNHLGSKQWEKIKREAQEKIRDTAVELLEIYANRLKTQGFSFNKPEADYERFATTFPFIVTPDQKRAIDEVMLDMTSGRSMDRLICGDVGFGKTEVAMRAAFLAAYNGKQVAILAPTTLLVQQHFTNFQDRFSSWPFKIALFSRFRNPKEQKGIVEDLANGKIDIVIGTHKLLQKNISFKNLGLLIIDEEHRFGVKQKEQIKQLASNIDILALTATPIPRTLNMAFAGIRDFSIISTPPAKRLAIKTFVHEYEPHLIKEAILRETLRGGQVYFLHNNITTIEKTARELQRLIPTIHLAIAHGQMRKQQLEQIMRDFYHLQTNVLLCTTIIESGIDIPTANTIIIDRADRFGLAQLHQIRGRVGRSHHQAYAYLIVPPKEVLTTDAKKRLDAVVSMKDLGTGFTLATHDLEIRGAGELLGEKQSGVMQSIGFTLYMEMLERAVKALKKGKGLDSAATSEIKTELELQIPALILDKYVSDVNLRLVLYKKIADAKDQNRLDELQVEMIDRFGLLPEYTKNLFKIAALKLKAQKLGILKIMLGKNKGAIQFAPDYTIDPKVIIKLMQTHCDSYKFLGAYTVEFTVNLKTSKIEFIDKLLDAIVSNQMDAQ